MKFDLFLEEALALGYDGIAMGHYARTCHVDERDILPRTNEQDFSQVRNDRNIKLLK